jgi:hypothetical protein
MIKKMMLLVSALAAFAALAVPATASADTWADNGVALSPGQDIAQSYEGYFGLDVGPLGKFGCQTTISVTTSGPHAATVTKFAPTTATCTGTIAFADCKMVNDTSNVPWNIGNASTPLTLSKSPGNMTIHYTFVGCAGKQTTLHQEFAGLSVSPEGTNPITKLLISGTSTSGTPFSGVFVSEGTATRGLVN